MPLPGARVAVAMSEPMVFRPDSPGEAAADLGGALDEQVRRAAAAIALPAGRLSGTRFGRQGAKP